MVSLIDVVIYSLLGGVVSLIGGFLLLSNEANAKKLATYATPFAAGALLAAAFNDLLKEAGHTGNYELALRYGLIGILLFFLLERFLHWFHHHHEHETKEKNDPTKALIVIGDTLHNIIDGIAIGVAFSVDQQTGIVVTLAVAAHEIPQEIGDFGLLLSKGMARSRVLLINFISALATTVAAVIFFQIGEADVLQLEILLGLTAGMFIYIAASDIIPTIHQQEERKIAGPQTLMLLLGVLVVSIATSYLHQYIETDSHDHSTDQSEQIEHDH